MKNPGKAALLISSRWLFWLWVCYKSQQNNTRDTNHTYPEPQLFSTACFGHDFRDHALCIPIFCIGVSRFTTPLSCIPLSSLLQIFRYFAADPACCSCIFCNSRPFGHQKSRFPKKATLLLRLLDGRRIHHHVNLRWYREPFPTSIVYKRESAKRRLPSCKTGTLAGVALSCISFDPKGVWLLRNLPPQSALLLYVYFIISILVCKAVCCFLTVAENAYCFR